MADTDILVGAFKVNTEDLDKAKEKIADLKDGVPNAEQAIGKLTDAFTKLPGPVGLAVTAIAAVGAALTTAAIAMAEHIEQVNHLSESYGLSASQADLMSEAAKRAGGSLDSVEAIYAKVAKAAYNASDPLKGTGAAFAELGINVNDSNGKLKSSSDLVEEAVEKWKNGAQTTADFAAMQQVLGKKFIEQLPALEATNAAKQLANDLESKGIYISKESVQATEDYSKSTLEAHGVMSAFGSQLVSLIVPQLTAMVEWFNKSAESGGVVAVAFDVLSVAMKGILIFIDAVVLGFKILGDVLVGVGKTIGNVAASFVLFEQGKFSAAKDALLGIADVAKDMAKSIKDDIDGMNKLGDATIAAGKGTKQDKKKNPYDNAGGDQKNNITDEVRAPVDPFLKYIDSLNKMLEGTEHLTESEKAESEIARIRADIAQKNADIDLQNAAVREKGSGVIKQHIADISAEEQATIRLTAAKIDNQARTNALTADLEKSTASVQRYVDSLNAQINKGKLTTDQIALQNEIERIHAQTLQQILDLQAKGLATDEQVAALREKETTDVQEATRAHEQYIAAQKDWLKNGMQDYMTSLGTMEQGLEKLTSKGFQGLTDQITSLVTTGKANFKAFIASMLDDLAKLVIELQIVKPLMNSLMGGGGGGGLGGMLGGLFGGGGAAAGGEAASSAGDIALTMAANGGVFDHGVKMFASGGVVNLPTMFGMAGGGLGVAGEAGAEAIVPLPNGRSIPVQMLNGSSGGSSVVVQVPVTVNMSGSSGSSQDVNNLATQISNTVKSQVMMTLRNELRPGGILNKVNA